MPSKIRDIADILGITEAANPTKAVLTSAADGSSVSVYDSAGLLPLSDLTSGDQAYVESTNRFYMSNGSGWYNIALVNTNPSISVSGGSPIELDNEGGSTTITVTSSDPEEVPITFTAVTNAAFDDFATVTNVEGVFTITPKAAAITAEANDTGTITFRSSDGINIAAVNRTVNLFFQSIDSLTRSVSTVSEGGVVTFTLNVTGYDNGTTFPYTITGVSSADLDGIPLTGNLTVSNGSAALDVALVADYATEGTETITFSAGGLSSTVTVIDTSTAFNAFDGVAWGSVDTWTDSVPFLRIITDRFDDGELINGTANMSGTGKWIRVKMRSSVNSTRRVVFRLKLPDVAKNASDARNIAYNADLQILGMVHEKVSGANDHYLFSENNTHGFETTQSFVTGSTPEIYPWVAGWVPINTTGNPSGGLWGLKTDGGETGSTLTGRLVPPYSSLAGPTFVTNPSISSYVYSETSSPVAFGDYLWMRSPNITMSVGDYIWVVYGTDAVAAESLALGIQ